MRWNGIRDGFGKKFNWCFSKMAVGLSLDQRYTKGIWLEKLIMELFNRMYINEKNIVSKQEIEGLKQKFIIKETLNNDKEKLQRLKLFKVTKKVLQFLDVIQKH